MEMGKARSEHGQISKITMPKGCKEQKRRKMPGVIVGYTGGNKEGKKR
jgi:hypothetical protein